MFKSWYWLLTSPLTSPFLTLSLISRLFSKKGGYGGQWVQHPIWVTEQIGDQGCDLNGSIRFRPMMHVMPNNMERSFIKPWRHYRWNFGWFANIKVHKIINHQNENTCKNNGMLFLFSDPYQTLGSISSRLANPGKDLSHHKLNQKGWHKWGLYTVCFGNMREKQARAGTHALTFQNEVNIKQHLLCQQNCITEKKSGFPRTKMTVCPAVSSQKAKLSAHPRTERANKVHTSSLTPALTGLWVGFCPDVSHFLQATQWKGHICWNKLSEMLDMCHNATNPSKTKQKSSLLKKKMRSCPRSWINWMHPEEFIYFFANSNANFKGYLLHPPKYSDITRGGKKFHIHCW